MVSLVCLSQPIESPSSTGIHFPEIMPEDQTVVGVRTGSASGLELPSMWGGSQDIPGPRDRGCGLCSQPGIRAGNQLHDFRPEVTPHLWLSRLLLRAVPSRILPRVEAAPGAQHGPSGTWYAVNSPANMVARHVESVPSMPGTMNCVLIGRSNHVAVESLLGRGSGIAVFAVRDRCSGSGRDAGGCHTMVLTVCFQSGIEFESESEGMSWRLGDVGNK